MDLTRTSDKLKLAFAAAALIAAALLLIRPFDGEHRAQTPVDDDVMAEIEAEQQRIQHEIKMGNVIIQGS